jgi:Spy/CpxP family protein refolding chaperone
MKKTAVCLLIVCIAFVFVFTHDVFAREDIVKNILITFKIPSPAEQKSIAQQLKLNPEQNKQMKELNDRYQKESADLKSRYNKAYNDVVMLMKQEKPDQQLVNNTLKEFHSIHAEVLEKEVGYWMEMKTILTPAQNNKLWQVFEQNRVKK